jgi:hypothetical protein
MCILFRDGILVIMSRVQGFSSLSVFIYCGFIRFAYRMVNKN